MQSRPANIATLQHATMINDKLDRADYKAVPRGLAAARPATPGAGDGGSSGELT